MEAMMIAVISLGFEQPASADRYFCFAVLLRVGWFGVLRVKEITSLIRSDIYFTDDSVVLAIRSPKNRSSMGKSQFTVITDAAIISWLKWITSGLAPTTRVWPGPSSAFSRIFKMVLSYLGLESLKLTAGSIRPGGVTAKYLAGANSIQLLEAGRWASEASMRIYVQEAMSHLVLSQIPSTQSSRLKALNQQYVSVLESPPAAPWNHVFSRITQWPRLLKRRWRKKKSKFF